MSKQFNKDGTYNKTDWKAGDKITATKLNKIEDAIEAVNNNDISRHEEADARLDALESGVVANKQEIEAKVEALEDTVVSNKDAADLDIYRIDQHMTLLDKKIDDGVAEVYGVAETVDGKIAKAESDMDAMVAEVEDIVAEVAGVVDAVSRVNNIMAFGAKGDGVTDDTAAIQYALDNARGALFFPKGIYKISSGLVLRRNIDIIGFSRRDSVIRADEMSPDEDLLTVSITNNFGYGDVRGWRIANINLLLNASGRHALHINNEGLQMLGSQIDNCGLSGLQDNGGHGLYIHNNFAHGHIMHNQVSSMYLELYDANLIEKNIFSGNFCAVTLNLILGVRNNTIRSNTIVCRDGAVRIINGDNIRIENNQCEQPSMCENEFKSMFILEGRDRPCINTVITTNNFGGGTNLDRSIYIGNAAKTVIEHNHFVSVNIADVDISSEAVNTFLSSTNYIKSSVNNKRNDHMLYNLKVNDMGINTINSIKEIEVFNEWNGNNLIIKDINNLVSHYGYLYGGTKDINTHMIRLPRYFRPKIGQSIPVITSGGLGLIKHEYNGICTIMDVKDNMSLSIQPFHAFDDDVVTNMDFKSFSNFNSITTLNTGEEWITTNPNNIQLGDSGVQFITGGSSDKSTCLVDCQHTIHKIYGRFSKITPYYADSIRLVFRYVDENNYMYMTVNDINGYRCSIRKVTNGSNTMLKGVNSSKYDYANMDEFIVEVLDDSITVYINGQKMYTVDESTNNTSTKVGFELAKTDRSSIDLFGVIY